MKTIAAVALLTFTMLPSASAEPQTQCGLRLDTEMRNDCNQGSCLFNKSIGGEKISAYETDKEFCSRLGGKWYEESVQTKCSPVAARVDDVCIDGTNHAYTDETVEAIKAPHWLPPAKSTQLTLSSGTTTTVPWKFDLSSYYTYAPQPDITASELAEVLKTLLPVLTCRSVFGCDIKDTLSSAPPSVKRHFIFHER